MIEKSDQLGGNAWKINKTAKPEFLATFSEEDLNAYLEHLMELDLEELVVCS